MPLDRFRNEALTALAVRHGMPLPEVAARFPAFSGRPQATRRPLREILLEEVAATEASLGESARRADTSPIEFHRRRRILSRSAPWIRIAESLPRPLVRVARDGDEARLDAYVSDAAITALAWIVFFSDPGLRIPFLSPLGTASARSVADRMASKAALWLLRPRSPKLVESLQKGYAMLAEKHRREELASAFGWFLLRILRDGLKDHVLRERYDRLCDAGRRRRFDSCPESIVPDPLDCALIAEEFFPEER